MCPISAWCADITLPVRSSGAQNLSSKCILLSIIFTPVGQSNSYGFWVISHHSLHSLLAQYASPLSSSRMFLASSADFLKKPTSLEVMSLSTPYVGLSSSRFCSYSVLLSAVSSSWRKVLLEVAMSGEISLACDGDVLGATDFLLKENLSSFSFTSSPVALTICGLTCITRHAHTSCFSFSRISRILSSFSCEPCHETSLKLCEAGYAHRLSASATMFFCPGCCYSQIQSTQLLMPPCPTTGGSSWRA